MNEFKDLKPKPVENIPLDEVKKGIEKKLKIIMEKVSMNNSNISETKDVVKFLCRTTNSVVESLKDDGRITVKDLFKFGGAVTSLFPAIAGITSVPVELKDINDSERQELVELVKDELELSDNVESIVEKSLVIASEIKNLIELVKNIKANNE